MSDNGLKCHSGESWWEELHLALKVLMVIGGLLLGAGLLFLFGYIVMVLWNGLMPVVFGLKTVTYWQAWGLLVLSCILFKGFGGVGGGGGRGGKSARKKIAFEIEKNVGEEIRNAIRQEIREEIRREREKEGRL